MDISIRIARSKTNSTTDVGKILEDLTANLLSIQSYSVKKRVRFTGVEADIIAQHKISNKEIWVECKAYGPENKIQSEVIWKLMGITTGKKYSEGWLISTSELSKDAEGLIDELKKEKENDKYLFYSPDKLIEAYIDGKIVENSIISQKSIESILNSRGSIEKTSLIISEINNFWAFTIRLVNGNSGILFTNAKNSQIINDSSDLDFLADSEVLGSDCDYKIINLFSSDNISETCPNSIGLDADYIKETSQISIRINHPTKNNLKIGDIFVYPTLQNIDDNKEDKIESKLLSDDSCLIKQCIIFGDDLSGKTVLAQKLQRDFNAKNFFSIYVDAEDINSPDELKFLNLLKNNFKKQYSFGNRYIHCFEEVLTKNNPKLSLIIDNYESIGIKRMQARIDFHLYLKSFFGNIVIFANRSMEIEVTTDSLIKESYSGMSILRIKQLGHYLRDELIEKWLIVDSGDSLTDTDIHNKKIEISGKIKIAVGTNFVPTYPIYILTILQLIETTSTSKLQGSTYSELYSSLITQSLSVAGTKPDELDFYLTYLSYFAFYLFEKKVKFLSFSDSKKMHGEYCEKMYISSNFDDLYKTLIKAQIIRQHNDKYFFAHNYSYFFFVAKYLSDNIEVDYIKKTIEEIVVDMYLSENANVLIFLIHHSKNKSLIERIIDNSQKIFREMQPYSISEASSSNIKKLFNNEVGFTIKDEKPIEYRKKSLIEKDRIDEKNAKDQTNNESKTSSLDLFGKINLSFKMLQILGQITQNYYGSMDGNKKAEILIECHSLGFRSLSALLQDFEKFSDGLRSDIKKEIDKRKAVDKNQKDKIIDKIIRNFTEMIVYTFVKKISDSVASKKIFPALDKILGLEADDGVVLVNLAARLNFPGGLDKEEILKLDSKFINNPLARRLLRILIIEYMYKFDINISDKQSLCKKMEINLIQNKEKLG